MRMVFARPAEECSTHMRGCIGTRSAVHLRCSFPATPADFEEREEDSGGQIPCSACVIDGGLKRRDGAGKARTSPHAGRVCVPCAFAAPAGSSKEDNRHGVRNANLLQVPARWLGCYLEPRAEGGIALGLAGRRTQGSRERSKLGPQPTSSSLILQLAPLPQNSARDRS